MTFKTILLGFAAAIATASSAQAATNLVVNGSFDAITYAEKTTFRSHVPGWDGGANLTFIAPPGSADDQNQYLAIYGPFPATSPDGGNFVLADGDSTLARNGRPRFRDAITQSISDLTIGQVYKVSFFQAAGQQFGFTGPTTERWIVSFGDETQFSSTFSLPQGGVGPWERQTLFFTATAATQVLSFLADGTPGGAPPISLLDGVSLAAVPEAATWAMLIAGFGLVGAAARRRRGVVAA